MTVEQYIDILLKMDSHDIVKSGIDCGQAYTYIELPEWLTKEIGDLEVDEIDNEYLYILSRGDRPTREDLIAAVILSITKED